jgi:MFS family permease
MSQSHPGSPKVNSPATVLFASLIGTTIEFFDFYIYATAAVLVFPKLFFPASDPTAATLQSLATFAIAFFARPVGSAVFGHFGDRIGRKATLVAALLTMGMSTVAIGCLPTYAIDRHAGAAAAGAVPLRPGPGPGRRVGRRGIAGHRERAAGQARLVWHVPAAGRADRLLPVGRHLPAAVAKC